MRMGIGRRKSKRTPCGGQTAWPALHAWFESPLGQQLLQSERRELDEVLPNLFGYHAVQIGQPSGVSLLDASRIRHRVILDELSPRLTPASHLQATPAQLPLASDSIDLVLLSHVLEFSEQPHEVLREIDRVLIPEGHVVILGFNPLSLWGVRRLLTRRRHSPWCGHFYSVTRLKDWLALLGFDTVTARGYFFRPPVQRASAIARLAFLERIGRRWFSAAGGAYVVVARKRVVTLTPIRPRWRPSRGLVGGLAKPTLNRDRTKG